MIISGGLDKEFDEYMEELGRKHERSKVYVDFMDYYIYQNSESNERKLPSEYTDKEMKLFDKAYYSFVELMQKLIEKYGWYDYLGKNNIKELVPDLVPILEHVQQQAQVVQPSMVQQAPFDYNILKDIARLETRMDAIEQRLEKLGG